MNDMSAEDLGLRISDKVTIIHLKIIIIGINDYEQEFVKTYFSVISEERVERETEGKIARQHRTTTRNTRVRIKLRLEFELHKLRLETESIRSNVRRASCAEDPKTSSNYRINIVRVEEHERETFPAILMAKPMVPVTTPIKEEKKIDYLRVVHVKGE
ncbi:hypothetical protein TNIN_193461 [Trichonephila inaurata madagascariensis]|uniref:Uncharacterized protein n=1 Tax=Trichonephila inaurata madagascariensis TaxID=2747483 RepID=A0A8X6XNC2_9ARAC|nr:hypothetical protein TNIN_193461 [Trichonephila inaurata madagascariensis]